MRPGGSCGPVDPTELRLEKIRNAVALAESVSHLHARLYVALIAVALTAVVSLVAAALAGGIPWSAATVAAAAPAGLTMYALDRIANLQEELRTSYKEANAAIDSLMLQEGEPEDDGTPPDP